MAIAVLSGGHAATCWCLGGGLLALAIALRWRDRVGVDAVRTGLVLGLVPALAALMLRSGGIECAAFGTLSGAELACFAAGAIAGMGVTIRVARTTGQRRRRWLLTLLVASITAALGCAGLGIAGVVTTLVAVIGTASIVWIPVAARAT
ncbi:MAG: hypothetical protein WKG01_26970 [Kofleriaceae bacterium]